MDRKFEFKLYLWHLDIIASGRDKLEKSMQKGVSEALS